MPEKSTAAESLSPIQKAALARFAAQGFKGASLAQIAGDVGIKTPSLYAHHKGKDDLYLSLLAPVVERELDAVRSALEKRGPLAAVLHTYLKSIGARFESSPRMRFLLQAAYLPPAHLHRDVSRHIDGYMDATREMLAGVFAREPGGAMSPAMLAEAFQGIVDSLQAEILYGGKIRFQRRLAALWTLFANALQG